MKIPLLILNYIESFRNKLCSVTSKDNDFENVPVIKPPADQVRC